MQTSAMLVLEPIFEADLPKEQYCLSGRTAALWMQYNTSTS